MQGVTFRRHHRMRGITAVVASVAFVGGTAAACGSSVSSSPAGVVTTLFSDIQANNCGASFAQLSSRLQGQRQGRYLPARHPARAAVPQQQVPHRLGRDARQRGNRQGHPDQHQRHVGVELDHHRGRQERLEGRQLGVTLAERPHPTTATAT